MSKKVLFQTIQISIRTEFSSIWLIDRTLSGATTPGLSGPGSDGSKGVLCIPLSSSITGALPSDCLAEVHFLFTQLNLKPQKKFQKIQFSISTHFSSIWLIDRTLSGATSPGLSGPGSKGNKGGTPHSSKLQH